LHSNGVLADFPAFDLIAGVDEAGRGPLAGPVVAAAVILDAGKPIAGLKDSKKLGESSRQRLDREIRERALAFAIAHASVEEIDQLNILQASLLAMQRAVNALSLKPEFILADGNQLPRFELPAQAIVRGDEKVAAISAASILAKVHRDAIMTEYHRQFPDFSFHLHKGYPTRRHLLELNQYGCLAIHRRTFRPVKAVIEAGLGSAKSK
jgi:ribonuclease HII